MAVGCVAQLWRRAIGHPVRGFRSSAHEQQCWQALAALDQQLRRLLRRGGVIVLRLDRPEDSCRMNCRPDDPRLPVGSPIDVYDALASTSPVLATLARRRYLLDEELRGPWQSTDDGRLRDLFAPYLAEARRFAFPCLAFEVDEWLAAPLLTTPAGACVSAASDGVLLLPPLGMSDPRREATCLLATLDRVMAESAATAGIGLSSGRPPPQIRRFAAGENLADAVLSSDERAALLGP
ncbi:MAG: hypothetical protein R3C10_10895 [Pirellulales bacterium]